MIFNSRNVYENLIHLPQLDAITLVELVFGARPDDLPAEQALTVWLIDTMWPVLRPQERHISHLARVAKITLPAAEQAVTPEKQTFTSVVIVGGGHVTATLATRWYCITSDNVTDDMQPMVTHSYHLQRLYRTHEITYNKRHAKTEPRQQPTA